MLDDTALSIAVIPLHDGLLSQAKQLAVQLTLPYCVHKSQAFQFFLVLTDHHLELHDNSANPLSPFFIDFTSGALGYRLTHSKMRAELLARAIGYKASQKPVVLDVTAGLGRDGFILANMGCAVLLLERSKIIAALLQDGLNRALHQEHFQSMSIKLINIDAITYLKQLDPQHYPDVIYLDPMYPDRSKTALVKKEMRWLRKIVGDDEDSALLLTTAFNHARKRVVVKRPRLAPTLTAEKPSFAITGKTQRFDVYVA